MAVHSPTSGPCRSIVVSKLVAAVTRRSLENMSRRSGVDLFFSSTLSSAELTDRAAVAVVVPVPHAEDEVMEMVHRIRELAPTILLCGVIDVPDQSLWLFAERNGFNLVSSAGGIGAALSRRLAADDLGVREPIAVLNSSDIAGRLGLLGEFEVEGCSVALWRGGGRLGCLENRCTHSGAKLSEGEVEDGVVTCPRHGSRFDIVSGERVRGPADSDVKHFDVFEREGRVWIVPEP